MKKNLYLICIMLCFTALFAACGGGGGSSASNTPTQATKAIVKLISTGTGTTICGIDVTVNLASGVTVRSTNPPQVDSGVITPSGVAGSGTIATAVYSAATNTQPGKLRVLLANANGLTTGEFCTVNADIASGATPASGEFSISNFSASDSSGNVISGISPTYSVVLQ